MSLLHLDSYAARAVELQPLPRPGAAPAILGALLSLLVAAPALGLIMVGKGNDPVKDNNWPAGSLDVANLKARVAWMEGPPFGGGQYTFLYRGDTPAFQAALDAFAKIKAPVLELYVHEGPHESFVLKDDKDPKADATVDWSFTIWNPDNWNRLYNNPNSTWNAEDPNFRKPLAAPRMDVYVRGPGGVDWPKVKVPAGVKVTDQRASANGINDGSAVVGDVFDLHTSKPVAGAVVTVEKNKGQGKDFNYVYETVATGKSNDAGHFEIRKVPAGNYRVTVSAGAAVPRVLGYVQFKNDTLVRFEKVQLAGRARVAGTVVDVDGKPVAGVKVRADAIMAADGQGYNIPDRPDTTTDAAGKFAIDGLPAGHCQLFTYSKTHAGVDALKVHAVPAEDVALKVTATGSVKGKVVQADGTPPAEQWMVHMEPEGGAKIGTWGGSMDVKKDGSFGFDNVPPGKYVLTAKPNPGPAANPPAKPVEIKAGQTAEVEWQAK